MSSYPSHFDYPQRIPQKCYVYTHRTSDGKPFYVGMGLKYRAWNLTQRNKAHIGRIRNLQRKQKDIIVQIEQDGLSRDAAILLEQELIAYWGRIDEWQQGLIRNNFIRKRGALLNFTDGGEGMSSEDARRFWDNKERRARAKVINGVRTQLFLI